jgi:hypothetical protein
MGQEGHIFIMPERVWHVVHEPGQAPSFLGINLVKVSTIGEVDFGGLLPASKGFFDFEQLDLGKLFGVFGLGLG